MSSGDFEKKWEELRIDLTKKANIFEKTPISNTVALSTYYQVSERIFSLAEKARDQKEWDTVYIYMKRYIMLTARELKKHNAFGQVRYRVDRERARARCNVAIENIKLATTHLKNKIGETTTKPKMETVPTIPPQSSPEVNDLMRRLKVLSDDSSDMETSMKNLEISSGIKQPPLPSAKPILKKEIDDEKFEKVKPMTREEKAALDRLRLPSNVYADSNSGLKNIPKVRTTQSPYSNLLKSLERDGSDDHHHDGGQLPAYMRYNTGGARSVLPKRKMSTGGVNEKDRAFRKSLLSARAMRVVDCKMDGNCLFRAVSHQMYGTQEKHAKIRKDVCDYMRSQKERFKWLVEEDRFEDYVRARELPVFKGQGEWGDHAEIIVMEELFDRPIEIYAPSDGPYKPRKTHMEGELPDQLKSVTPIRLHYQGNNHYNSIVVDRGASNAPRDRDRIPLPMRHQGILSRYRAMTMA
jgi:hypothetical protein